MDRNNKEIGNEDSNRRLLSSSQKKDRMQMSGTGIARTGIQTANEFIEQVPNLSNNFASSIGGIKDISKGNVKQGLTKIANNTVNYGKDAMHDVFFNVDMVGKGLKSITNAVTGTKTQGIGQNSASNGLWNKLVGDTKASTIKAPSTGNASADKFADISGKVASFLVPGPSKAMIADDIVQKGILGANLAFELGQGVGKNLASSNHPRNKSSQKPQGRTVSSKTTKVTSSSKTKLSAEGNLLKKLHNTRISSSSNYRTGHHKVGNARFKK